MPERHTEPVRPAAGVSPHPLSSDLTDQPDVRTDSTTAGNVDSRGGLAIEARSETRAPRDKVLTRVEAGVGKTMLKYVVGIVVLGFLVSAVVLREWWLLGIGAIVFIPYMLFILAPIWLADTTKVAQDETVREQRESGNG